MGEAPYPFPADISTWSGTQISWSINLLSRTFYHASSCPVNEIGLGLKVTVEPVVGDHSPSNDNESPCKDGDHARHPGGTGRHGVKVPL